MNQLEYLEGSGVEPMVVGGSGGYVIAHVCNGSGVWEGGFMRDLSEKFGGSSVLGSPEWVYRTLCEREGEMESFGKNQYISVKDDRYALLGDDDRPRSYVCSMIAQLGLRTWKNRNPLSMQTLKVCLESLRKFAEERDLEVHIPRLDTNKTGGNWKEIEKLLIQSLVSEGIPVVVYNPTRNLESTQYKAKVGDNLRSRIKPDVEISLIEFNGTHFIARKEDGSIFKLRPSTANNLYTIIPRGIYTSN
mgnify:CR=1 FL=1